MCAKLGNTSRAAIFFTYFHREVMTILMYNVTLILLVVKKNRLVTTLFTFLTNLLHYKNCSR